MLKRFWYWLMTRMGRDSRGLFLFWDGRSWRTVDALECAREFLSLSDFDWDDTPSGLDSAGGTAITQLHAVKGIAKAVRQVFHIKSVADGGLTESECLEVFWNFRTLLGLVKKNGKLFQTLEDSTQNPSDDMPVPPSLPSASGSIVTEPSSEPAGSLPVATAVS